MGRRRVPGIRPVRGTAGDGDMPQNGRRRGETGYKGAGPYPRRDMMQLFKRKEAKAEKPAKEQPKTAQPKQSAGQYFVSPHPDGGWQVKRAGAQKALKRFKTKAEAEDYAKKVASNQGTGVVRQRKDGTIQKKK